MRLNVFAAVKSVVGAAKLAVHTFYVFAAGGFCAVLGGGPLGGLIAGSFMAYCLSAAMEDDWQVFCGNGKRFFGDLCSLPSIRIRRKTIIVNKRKPRIYNNPTRNIENVRELAFTTYLGRLANQNNSANITNTPNTAKIPQTTEVQKPTDKPKEREINLPEVFETTDLTKKSKSEEILNGLNKVLIAVILLTRGKPSTDERKLLENQDGYRRVASYEGYNLYNEAVDNSRVYS